MKQLYDTTKKLEGKYSKTERPVTDKEDMTITEIRGQRNRWVEHFDPDPLNPSNIQSPHTDNPIDVTPPTTDEIRMVIGQIESVKAV
ncbi:unnamed protein product [Schistosoma curassoni]|uniref:Nonstructural protein n=1 Tax=Schistosoma curassoni TaxID=6186 RepID=A0A183JIS9_9TREM|nr:unnamed protein product [Schistosoma curassoni]